MHLTRVIALAAVILALPALALAQNPMMAAVKAQHEQVKGYLLKTAETIPENLYSFRATPDVRTIAQLIGHVADGSAGICASASDAKPPSLNAEESMTTKAQLSKALAEAAGWLARFASTYRRDLRLRRDQSRKRTKASVNDRNSRNRL